MTFSWEEAAMSEEIINGSKKNIAGKPCIFYDGYWIKRYEPPENSLAAKKQLIEALTRRLFNHMEHGINVPGQRLSEVREAYETERDAGKKRVKGAMLAGALFNRAADIFKKVVELQECGVEIREDDALMHECGRCLMEALEFGKTVKHRSGDESIDELWGEPFKAFSMPIEDFYESRYIKIAQTMREIDQIGQTLARCLEAGSLFAGVEPSIKTFTEAAKAKCETLRTDPVIFEVWPSFVVAADHLSEFQPKLPPNPSDWDRWAATEGLRLIQEGEQILTDLTRARVPMPKSTAAFVQRCEAYRRTCERSDRVEGTA